VCEEELSMDENSAFPILEGGTIENISQKPVTGLYPIRPRPST